jgi:hypothetical protein
MPRYIPSRVLGYLRHLPKGTQIVADFNWDDLDDTNDYPERFKFTEPGQIVEGVVTSIRMTDFGGKSEPLPEIWLKLKDDTKVSIVASQVVLRRQLARERPQVDDHVTIVVR